MISGVISSLWNAIGMGEKDVEDDVLDSGESQVGQSAELQPPSSKKKDEGIGSAEPAKAQSVELSGLTKAELAQFGAVLDRCSGYSQTAFGHSGGGFAKQKRGVLKGLRASLKKAKADPTTAGLKARLATALLLEDELKGLAEQAEEEARVKKAEEASLVLTTPEVETPKTVSFEKPPEPDKEAVIESWTDHVDPVQLAGWQQLALTDPQAAQLLVRLEQEASEIGTLKGSKNKSKRDKARTKVRKTKSALEARVDAAEQAIEDAIVKPVLPASLKSYAWNKFTGFKFPVGGELKVDDWTARVTASATKHPQDELGVSPSEARTSAYLGSFAKNAEAFARGIKGGTYAESVTVKVGGWNLIGKKVNPKNNAGHHVEIYHADTGYEKASPWRNPTYLG